MLRLAAIALIAGLALPACAQRGGGGGGFHGGGGGFHGGFASRAGSGGGFRGGFSAPRSSAPRSFNGFSARPNSSFARMPRYARPFGYARPNGYRSPYNSWRNPRYGRSFGRPGFRQWRGDHDRFRDRFRERAFFGFAPPVFFIPDWIGLGTVGCYADGSVGYYDSFDDFDCGNMQPDDQDQYQDEPQVYGDDNNGYGSEPPPPPPDQPQYQQPQYQQPGYQPPAYHQPTPPSSPMPSSEIAANRMTTIFFNNGHAPEQIHDYALTGTTLYVLGQHQQEIPLSEIDLAKTEQTNRSAGIEFQVPEYQITQ